MKIFAMLMGKCASLLLRLIHRGGSLPGAITLRLCPSIYSHFHYTGAIIVVTGTNGKTSTSNMIADLFTAHGKRVISNRKGDNLKEGITTCILNHTSLFGKVHGDVMVLEVDELNVPYVMRHLNVTAFVVTNFFRDQLDRSKEMELLIQKIEAALDGYQGALILNGNDPNVLRLSDHAPQATLVTFGAEECSVSSKTTTEASEGKFCPRCNHALRYTYYQYSHIGVFKCSHCDFQTPKIDCEASDIDVQRGSFSFAKYTFIAPIHSLYTIYNCMAVLAIAKLHDIPYELVQTVFESVVQPQGRNETFLYQKRPYTLNLIKNPTGANEVLKVIEQDPEEKALMIVLNDNPQDGTDVSWIYDAQFERVLRLSTKLIVCSGQRAYDIALRMKYANYDGEIQVIEDFQKGLERLYEEQKKGYIIATYTALQPVRNAMRRDG